MSPMGKTVAPVLAYAQHLAALKRESYSVIVIPKGTAAYNLGNRYVSIPNSELPYYLANGATVAAGAEPSS